MTGHAVPAATAGVAAWVAAQEPPAPEGLAERVGLALGSADDAAGDDRAARAGACLAAAEALLGRLLADGATGTRSREAALDLLAADALVTYAFEAASEAPETLAALAHDAIRRLAAAGATPPRLADAGAAARGAR